MQKSKNFFKTIILAMVLSLGVSYIYAWAPPTANPPDGNVSAPINASGISQVKEGPLGINGAFTAFNGAFFQGDTGGGVAVDVTGKIKATDDICTDAGGGKCLSTAGGGGSGTGFVCKGTCPDLVAAE